MTELCDLALKYNSDKCPQIKHSYTPYYYDLLNPRRTIIKKVLEIGTAEGASLFMWRDFFPHAMIYGAEIDPERVKLMNDQQRIRVFTCDQRIESNLENVIVHTGPDLDLVIDDGSHVMADQIFSCKTLMPLLQRHTIYIIEDARYWQTIVPQLSEYNVEVPKLAHVRRRDNILIIVRHKSWPK
jgi:predicted O-methyltransferase YrrM